MNNMIAAQSGRPACAQNPAAKALKMPVAAHSQPPHTVVIGGTGSRHTDKHGMEYERVTLGDIRRLVDDPQPGADKSQARWMIPSHLPTRVFREQEANGRFWLLWADLDRDPPDLDRLAGVIDEIAPRADFEVYTTRSATEGNPKSRVILPLGQPLSGADWIACQRALNGFLLSAGIEPDRATERPAQLCYLPNRGEFYDTRYRRNDCFLSPLTDWADAIAEIRRDDQVQREAIEARRQEAAKRRQQVIVNGHDLIGTFNEAYTVPDILLQAGYDQRGSHFRHPGSESGSFSASVRDGRVFTLSTADPLYTGGQGAHDAFSAYTVLFHQGDQAKATRDAGDNWLTVGGESWNAVKRREFAEQKRLERNTGEDVTQWTKTENVHSISERKETNHRGGHSISLPTDYISVDGLENQVFSKCWLVEGLIEDSRAYQIFGAWKSGKTLAALDLCAHLATAATWAGRRTVQTLVIWVASESCDDVKRRMSAWRLTHQAVGAMTFYVRTKPVHLDKTKFADQLAAEIGAIRALHPELPVLVVIDTVARSMSGETSENDEGLRLFANNVIDRVVRPLKVAAILVHHSGHADRERGRGWSGFPAALDGTIKVAMDKSGQGTFVDVSTTEMRSTAGDDSFRFRVDIQEIHGQDNFGNTMEEPVLHYTGEYAPKSQSKAKAPAKSAHDALEILEGMYVRHSDNQAASGMANATPRVRFSDWRNAVKDSYGASVKANTKHTKFRRVHTALLEGGYIVGPTATDPHVYLANDEWTREDKSGQSPQMSTLDLRKEWTGQDTTLRGCPLVHSRPGDVHDQKDEPEWTVDKGQRAPPDGYQEQAIRPAVIDIPAEHREVDAGGRQRCP